MTFSLEALKARHGDCLLLHYDQGGNEATILIDGGPSTVYDSFLRPRLDRLREDRGLDDQGTLTLDMLMVSHIDDDHIRGILELFRDLRDAQDDADPLPFDFVDVWFNSFDDIVGNNAVTLQTASSRGIDVASVIASGSKAHGLSHRSALVVQSVNQGRTLRNDLDALGLDSNGPWFMPIFSVADPAQDTFEIAPGLELLVVGPPQKRVESLQKKWDADVKKAKAQGTTPSQLEAAAYVDSSVANLSSLVVLAQAGNRSMLLTGDARGDDILDSLEELDLFDAQGRFHVDLLKLPHHGSDNNVETDFFRRVTARHYVVSGDGEHHNPEIATFQMIKDARGSATYTVWMTYAPDDLRHDYKQADRNRLKQTLQGVDVRFPAAGETSVTVSL